MLNYSMFDGYCTKDVVLFVNPNKCTAQSPYGGFSATVDIGVNGKYKNKAGEYETTYVPLKMWGKMAARAATYLKKGSRINVVGVFKDFVRDRGLVTESGKKEYVHKPSFVVTELNFGAPTYTEITEAVRQNLAVLKAAGRIPENVNITAEEIIAMPKKPSLPEAPNWNVINQTGKFGNSPVFINDGVNKHWANAAMTGVNPNASPAPAQNAPVQQPTGNLTPEQLRAEAARLLQAAGVADTTQAGAAAGIDPFAS